jgi:hypothetical protein
MKKLIVRIVFVGAVATASWVVAENARADGFAPIVGALGETKPIVDTRLRFESVDQQPFASKAEASTFRIRAGFETGKAWGTALLVEGVAIVPLQERYNNTNNGKTTFPIVADPENYALNRLQLVNTLIPNTTLTLGRQRLVLDDHRFVGNVGWRQNEQTYDAFRVINKSVPNVTIGLWSGWIARSQFRALYRRQFSCQCRVAASGRQAHGLRLSHRLRSKADSGA